MKALKIIGGILLLVIIAFFLIGVISPRTTYENSVTIEKPVEVVWDVFTDEDKMDQWLVGMQSIETLEGEAMTEGSRYRLTFVMEGEKIDITERVTRIKEDELFAFTLDSEPLTSEVEIHFTPVDSNTTQVKAITTSEGKGIVWKPIITLSSSVMQQQSQQSYIKLKELVEAQADTAKEAVSIEQE